MGFARAALPGAEEGGLAAELCTAHAPAAIFGLAEEEACLLLVKLFASDELDALNELAVDLEAPRLRAWQGA